MDLLQSPSLPNQHEAAFVTAQNARPVALVTGATSGIGRATAQKLAASGWDLLLTGRRVHRLHEVADEATSRSGVLADVRSIDFADLDGLSDVLTDWLASVARLDAVVHAAGVGVGFGGIRAVAPKQWQREVEIDLLAAMAVSQTVLPRLDTSRGTLVLVGSVFSYQTAAQYASYCAAKHAVLAYSRALRKERTSEAPARVCVVSPGTTRTEFTSVMLGRAPEVYAADRYPYPPLEPTDVADAIEWVLRAPSHVEYREILLSPTAEVEL